MEWKEDLLGNLIDALIDYRGKTPKKQSFGIPLITAKIIKNGSISEPTEFISEDQYHLWMTRGFPVNGDVILTTEAPLGEVAQLDFRKVALAQRVVCFRGKKNMIDNTYLKYYFLSYYGQQALRARETGTTVTGIKQSELKKVIVKYPSFLFQRKIAGILSALDSKIENNNKINANLEAQAQALFKSWFVDFTPFKDQPFVDSELGPIPQGWKVGKLGDICTFKRGKNLLSKNAIDEGVPVVAGGLSPSCYHNQANTSAPVVTVSGSGANAGFMRMYHVDVWASDCSFIDVSCDYLYFVYCFLSVNRRLLKHAQTGAVQPHVKPADIHDFDVVIPEEDIVKAFQSIIKELLTKVGVNEKENQRLAALRDTLLPKLMSGEIKL
ncbi:MAG: restriction endonuclease subunit S [Sodaliphilus sp.]|nr:restriction endonuclease subunit S [Sodaliphilus sp.]